MSNKLCYASPVKRLSKINLKCKQKSSRISNKNLPEVSKSILSVSTVVYEQCYMNNNCQEYDFSMESLLLHCNKPFQFCLKDTQIRFLLITF